MRHCYYIVGHAKKNVKTFKTSNIIDNIINIIQPDLSALRIFPVLMGLEVFISAVLFSTYFTCNRLRLMRLHVTHITVHTSH